MGNPATPWDSIRECPQATIRAVCFVVWAAGMSSARPRACHSHRLLILTGSAASAVSSLRFSELKRSRRQDHGLLATKLCPTGRQSTRNTHTLKSDVNKHVASKNPLSSHDWPL